MAKPSIEDRLAIEDLFVRYTAALDEGDVEGVVSCFTEDGWLDSPIVGRHQGEASLRAFAAKDRRARNGPERNSATSSATFASTSRGTRGERAAISWTSPRSLADPNCCRPANTIASCGKSTANGSLQVEW